MRDPMSEAEERQLDWGLGEVEGGHPAPDLTESILARIDARVAGASRPGTGADRPVLHHPGVRRRWWAAVAIAVGLAIVAAIAWLDRVVPSHAERYLSPRDGGAPAIEVRTPAEARGLAATARNVAAHTGDIEILRAVGALRQLQFLDLSARGAGRPPVTDAGLDHLSGLSKLRELDLSGQTSITAAGLARLTALPILESLSLARTDVRADTLAQLARMPGLRRLDLSDCRGVDGTATTALGRIGGLKWLSLRGARGSASTLAPLAGLTLLESLDLSGFALDDGDAPGAVAALRTLPRLGWLRLARSDLATDPGLARLAVFRQLERLDLSGNSRITVTGIRELPSTLRDLDLGGCAQLTDATAIAVGRRLVNLRSLDLGGCARVTDAGVTELLAAGTFHRLTLSGTAVTESIVDALLAETGLEELELEASWMTPAIRARLDGRPR